MACPSGCRLADPTRENQPHRRIAHAREGRAGRSRLICMPWAREGSRECPLGCKRAPRMSHTAHAPSEATPALARVSTPAHTLCRVPMSSRVTSAEAKPWRALACRLACPTLAHQANSHIAHGWAERAVLALHTLCIRSHTRLNGSYGCSVGCGTPRADVQYVAIPDRQRGSPNSTASARLARRVSIGASLCLWSLCLRKRAAAAASRTTQVPLTKSHMRLHAFPHPSTPPNAFPGQTMTSHQSEAPTAPQRLRAVQVPLWPTTKNVSVRKEGLTDHHALHALSYKPEWVWRVFRRIMQPPRRCPVCHIPELPQGSPNSAAIAHHASRVSQGAFVCMRRHARRGVGVGAECGGGGNKNCTCDHRKNISATRLLSIRRRRWG